MNEHIMDALVQADKYAWKKAGKKYDAVGDLNWKWEDSKNEKFAELLLNKCIELVDPGIASGEEWFRARAAAVQELKDYFEID